MPRRRRKTKHEKTIDLLNTQAIQNIAYTMAKYLETPETSMALTVLAIEFLKPKVPEEMPPKTFTGTIQEKMFHDYEKEFRGIGISRIGRTTSIGTVLPQIKTMSPIPDFSDMDIWTATQIALLFGIVLKNVPKTEVGVL